MYRQSITTKYLGPTNSRGSRVKVSAPAGSITVSWDYGVGETEMHAKAVRALIDKLNWDGVWAAGGNADNSGSFIASVSGVPVVRPPVVDEMA